MRLKICFLGLLCLFFGVANGQGLKIGDKVPDVLVRNISGLVLNGKVTKEARLSAFAGKLLILDFWATWCAPCRAMAPVMDSLQHVFKDQVQFLPVTYEAERVVAPVLAQMRKAAPFDLPEVTGDLTLNALFPHRALPHYVWIDGAGVVRAITEDKEVTGKNIRAMLLPAAAALPEKKELEIPYNTEAPLLVDHNGGDGSALMYHSVLSGYIPGLSSGLRISAFDPLKGQLFTLRNNPFVWLCRLAYNDKGRWFPDALVRILSKDSLHINSHLVGQAYDQWLSRGNGYSYELLVPPALAIRAFPILQEELRRLFPQYAVTVEPQQLRSLVLVRTSGTDKLKTSGGKMAVDINPYGAKLRNSLISELVKRLQVQYLQNSPLPVTDGTGYTGRVDLDIDAKLYDVEDLNAALARYDLRFVEKESRMEMLVIRDTALSTAPAAE